MSPTFKDCPYKDNLAKRQDALEKSIIRLEDKLDNNHEKVIDKISGVQILLSKYVGIMGVLMTITYTLINKFLT